ncbi:hypothetical protein [Rubinisphaera sp.]|uniref:hypothetical protein n=1 Tax=Rubinisphaera sp. TaxID=2024857 RepID=UPI0025FA0080|nr:hypothetical protein [Rubinisphaera sp.]
MKDRRSHQVVLPRIDFHRKCPKSGRGSAFKTTGAPQQGWLDKPPLLKLTHNVALEMTLTSE